MKTYQVTVKQIEEESQIGAFVGIDCNHDFEKITADGNEVYTVTSERDISHQLDASDGVIIYVEL